MKKTTIFRALIALLIVMQFTECKKVDISLVDNPTREEEPVNPPKEDLPVVYDYSLQDSSGVSVVNYNANNNCLEIIASEDKLPKVGDIICSGITEYAPYGFLGKVSSVEILDETKGGDVVDLDVWKKKAVVSLVGMNLLEALHSLGIEKKGWWRVGTDLFGAEPEIRDDEGHKIIMEKQLDGAPTVLKIPLKIPLDDGSINYQFECSMVDLGIYLDTSSDMDLVIGFDLTVKVHQTLNLCLKDKLVSYDGDVLRDAKVGSEITVIHPFTIPYTPIVITFMARPTLPYELSLSGNIEADVIDDTKYYHLGGYYHTLMDTFTPLEDTPGFAYVTQGDDMQENLSSRDIRATIEGKASFGVDAEISFGLFGGNLVDNLASNIEEIVGSKIFDADKFSIKYFSVGINVGAKLEDKLSLGASVLLDNQTRNRIKIIDDNKFESYLYGKMWACFVKDIFKIGDLEPKIELFTAEKECKLLKTELHNPFFFPYYSKLKLKSMTYDGLLNLSAERSEPMMASLLKSKYSIYEKEYGFYMESIDGNDYWEFDISDKNAMDSKTGKIDYDLPVPYRDLRRNVWYSIYPFSKIHMPDNESGVNVYREGINFYITDDNQLSISDIDGVIGENF